MSISTYPSFGAALRAARHHKGLTQKALADTLHINQASLSQLESGRSQPSGSTLMALMNIGITIRQTADGGYECMYSDIGISNVVATYVDAPTSTDLLTPILNQYIHAGEPMPVIEDDAQMFNVSKHYRDTLTVVVAGDSMTGAGIEDGDKVVIRARPTWTNGDIVLASLNGALMLKGIMRDKDGVVWLVPANEHFQPIAVQVDDAFEVRGVMIELIRRAKRGWMKQMKGKQ